jgi:hypothetical protein
MTNTATESPALDLDSHSLLSLTRLLRGMVAMRKDTGFLRRERVDLDAMGLQADEFYSAMLRRDLSPAQISQLVPGVEVFA